MAKKFSRRSFLLGTGATALMTPALSGLMPNPAMAADDEACDALFVIRAANITFDGKQMMLDGTDPNITYFCDRPVRTAGHLTIAAMQEIMHRAENSFLENPPNAAVSVFGKDGSITDAVVTLTRAPVVSGDHFRFDVRVVDGELPDRGGAVALFVDPVGVPMSPTSVAGVHRRHRRRAIRRHN
jgi:hypothetical protein